MLKKEKKKEKKKSREGVDVLRYNFSPSDLAFNAKRLLTVLKSIWFRLRTKKLKHEHLSKFILDSSREKEKYLTPDIPGKTVRLSGAWKKITSVKNVRPTPPTKSPLRSGTEVQIWAKKYFFCQSCEILSASFQKNEWKPTISARSNLSSFWWLG